MKRGTEYKLGGAPNMEIRSNTQGSRSASPKVGLIWSAKDRRVEREGLAPPETKHGGTAAMGGR